MHDKQYDFAGWVTKNDIQCTDGVTIRHGAFAKQDGVKVPLVWEHKHDNPENVLGHIILEHRDEGVYGYAKCNSTPNGQNAKVQVKEGDITSFSIYANKVMKKGADVVHGVIREVSLVLSGANPGAMIIEHSDMSDTLKHMKDPDSIITYMDDYGGSFITEISHGDDFEGRSVVATPARASDAQGVVNADSIGNLSANTLGRQSANSLLFCTECGAPRRGMGRFCGQCGSNMHVDSRVQAINEDRTLRNVQHSFNPEDSFIDTEYDESVLAHEGTSGYGGSGESGAQGDGPISDSQLADTLVNVYGQPHNEDPYSFYSEMLEVDEINVPTNKLRGACNLISSSQNANVSHANWGITGRTDLDDNLRRQQAQARQNVADATAGTRAGIRQDVGNVTRPARQAVGNAASRVADGAAIAGGQVAGVARGVRDAAQGAAQSARGTAMAGEAMGRVLSAAARNQISQFRQGLIQAGVDRSERIRRVREYRQQIQQEQDRTPQGVTRHTNYDDVIIQHNTIEDIFATMTDEQQEAVAFLLSSLETNGTIAQSDIKQVEHILHSFDEVEQFATNTVINVAAESLGSTRSIQNGRNL